MNQTIFKVIFFISTVFATAAAAQDDIRDRLRLAIGQSLELPEAVQYVSFGPLTDGRVIELRIRFHSEGGAPSVEREIGSNNFLVQFPRHSLATTPFIEDAMLGCFIDVEVCSLMPSFLLQLQEASEPTQMQFFDELYPDHAETFNQLRQQEFWGPAVLGGIESAVLAVDTHEICHIVLGHLNDRVGLSSFQVEGEADGCMLYFFEVSELSPVGGIAYLMNSLFGEEILGEFSITHPAPSCRSLAMAEASILWFEANRAQLSDTESGIVLPSSQALRSGLEQQAGQSSVDCADYNRAAHEGRLLAASLFDENTNLTSDP